MKPFLCLSFILSAFLFSNAIAQDKKAGALLEKVSKQYQSLKSLTANFQLTIQDAQGSSSGSYNGKIYLKGNKYLIDMDQQKIISDGRSVWTYLAANKEVQISDASNSEMDIMNPAKLFSGHFKNDFTYTHKGEKQINGKQTEVISLVPRQKSSFQRIEVYIESGNHRITGGKVFDPGGSAYLYHLRNIKVDQAMPDSKFTFNPSQYPGVEVIDLR